MLREEVCGREGGRYVCRVLGLGRRSRVLVYTKYTGRVLVRGGEREVGRVLAEEGGGRQGAGDDALVSFWLIG